MSPDSTILGTKGARLRSIGPDDGPQQHLIDKAEAVVVTYFRSAYAAE
jgi:hypothetical protein